MTAYMWNLPSHKKRTIFLLFYSKGSFGEVQPRTYPPDLGFSCGMIILVNFFSLSICFARKRELLN
jgi:hypothetical protein